LDNELHSFWNKNRLDKEKEFHPFDVNIKNADCDHMNSWLDLRYPVPFSGTKDVHGNLEGE